MLVYFSLFALNKDFCLFAANHTDSSYISLKRTFFAVLVLNYAVFSLKKKENFTGRRFSPGCR